jgi:hypothetical protein
VVEEIGEKISRRGVIGASRDLLHELAATKGLDIERAEIKPFAVLTFRFKPVAII